MLGTQICGKAIKESAQSSFFSKLTSTECVGGFDASLP